jgi:iron complex outermembrane recepter protein
MAAQRLSLSGKPLNGRLEVTGTVRFGRILNTVLIGGDTLVIRSQYSQPTLLPAGTVDLLHPDYNRGIPTDYSPVRLDTKTKQTGGYVQDLLSLPHGLNVLAGLRYTSITDYTNATDQSEATPMVGVLYRPLSWLSLYGSHAESFIPVTGVSFGGAPFRPSLGKQFEVGLKSRFFSNRLSANLAWYRLRRTNVTSVDPSRPFFSIQSGEQQSRGIELEVSGNVHSRLLVIANYAYTDARVIKDLVYRVGAFLPQAPRHSASVWGTYEFPGALALMTTGAGVSYTGSWWDSILNTFQIPGNTTADAYLAWRFERRCRLQFNVKNALDRRYYAAAANLFGIYPGQRRSFQLSIAWSF